MPLSNNEIMFFNQQFKKISQMFQTSITRLRNTFRKHLDVWLITKKHAQIQFQYNKVVQFERYNTNGLHNMPLAAIVKGVSDPERPPESNMYARSKALILNIAGRMVKNVETDHSWSSIIFTYDEAKDKPDINEGDICLYTRHGDEPNEHLLRLGYKDKVIEMKTKNVEISLDADGKLIVDGREDSPAVKYNQLEATMKKLETDFNNHFHASMGAVPSPQIIIDISGAKSNKVFFD